MYYYQDWKPAAQNKQSPAPAPAQNNSQTDSVSAAITAQGDKIRTLKAAKAEKTVIDVEVKNLLNLKAQYKAITGKDWAPSAAAPQQDTKKTDNKKQTTASANGDMDKAAILSADIARQGDRVRELKTNKADKATIDAEVKKLLELKAQYQTETGSAYVAPTQPRETKPKDKKPKEEKKDKPKDEKKDKPKEEKKDKPKEVKKEPKTKEP
ncbi:PREDICTED: bifunctional glutamate/proline--tRNA ligase-like, partial [Papilio xuthus]|uniref:Bifunctional glutamate/proline--tRNA ligase-like n=1 Tax=Papilio xuthus TaxID=66420 RepID=A0AAJ6ZTL4_PAPXU